MLSPKYFSLLGSYMCPDLCNYWLHTSGELKYWAREENVTKVTYWNSWGLVSEKFNISYSPKKACTNIQGVIYNYEQAAPLQFKQ
jgi:hypothetical protein